MWNKPLIIALGWCSWAVQAQNLPSQVTQSVSNYENAISKVQPSKVTIPKMEGSGVKDNGPLRVGETSKLTLPVLVPSIGDVVESQRSRAAVDYVKRLNIVDPDIDTTGKLILPPSTPRLAFMVRYLHGDPGNLSAVVEYQGQQRQIQTGDHLMGYEVRVTRRGVSLFLTRKGRKQGWTEPLAPGLYQEYF